MNNWLLNILLFNSDFLLYYWDLYELLNDFFNLKPLRICLLNNLLNNFDCLLNNWHLSYNLHLIRFPNNISYFNYFFSNSLNFNDSILNFNNRDYLLYYSVDWHFLYYHIVSDLWSRVIHGLLDNDFFYLFNFHHFYNFLNNFLNSIDEHFNRFYHLNYFFCRDDLFNFQCNWFVVKYLNNFFLHNKFRSNNLHNLLYFSINLNNFWNLLNHLNVILDDFLDLNNLFYNSRNFNEFLDIQCLYCRHIQWNIYNIFNNFNFPHLNWDLHSVLCWHQLWYFYDLFNNFLNDLFNFNNFWHCPIDL